MISKEEVQHLAELARLKLSEAETEILQKDISNILDYVGQVAAVSGDEVKSAPILRNVMREDVPRDVNDIVAGKEEAVRSAFPQSLPAQTGESSYNVVRKIIQKDE